MYSIYADGKCIYTNQSTVDKWQAISPKLSIGDNCSGSLELKLPPKNEGYESVKRLTSEIVVYKDNVEIWSGRVVSENTDFYKNRYIYCEGELAYLNDSIQPPNEYHNKTVSEFLQILINIHNAQVDAKHQFTVGAVTVTDEQVTDGNDTIYRYTNYETTMECIQGKLIDKLGGHVRIRKVNGVRYIDYLKDWPNVNSQKIEFGKNLLDFTKKYDATEFITVLVPQGEALTCSEYSNGTNYKAGEYCVYDGYIYRAKVDISSQDWTPSNWTRVQKYIQALQPYLTVEEVNNGSIFVSNDAAVANYGKIIGKYTWDDVTDPSVLLSKARKYLSDLQFDNMVLELSAIDLHYMDIDIEAIRPADQVRVISVPHGLNRLFPVTKLEIPLNDPTGTTFTLGDEVKASGLSASTSQISTEIANKIDALPSSSSVLSEAVRNATALISMATNGYITITKGPNGTSELYISDEADYRHSTKLWRWNINGLGYSKDGGKTYGLAMTMDGSIVADYITSGIMSANRIRGGILQLGGSIFSQAGAIDIKDEQDRMLITINKYGMTLFDESGNGKLYLDHSGILAIGGTIKASNIMGTYISSECIIETDTFRVDGAGSIFNHGSTYSEGEGDFQRVRGRQGVQGNGLWIDGDKHRVVKTEHFGTRGFQAYETATGYFGDIGEAKTDNNGLCYIYLDDILLESTDNYCQYQVFVQPYNDSHLYIQERNKGYFIVHSDKPNISFSWEIKIPQKDMSGKRYPIPPYEILSGFDESEDET